MSVFGSTFFVALAVVIFLCALVGEIFSVREQLLEGKVTEKAINYLKKVTMDNHQAVVLKREKVGKDVDGQVWNWLKEHLAGSIDQTDKAYTAEIKNDKRFVLLEYPHVLARSVARSSLSFIPTLLTAIGLLGTFFGISTGLSKFDLSAINESDKLLAASIGVLEGMKTAFFSSLVGLGCASAFMVVLFVSSLARKTHRDSL